ncbi:phosphoribosyltransferase family protein [Aeromicrobium piscarium]|uniref:ComF family protein n=1 Tax=Aeromicrobium piscarium TaxID=2590901 RepID=A0A554S8S5_9ACTN|nr:phosphoribosyltransferase family protein [Aeromicrobium piscarium]TSD62751.1 ComF family protein [Aeromicrobium piscarium]
MRVGWGAALADLVIGADCPGCGRVTLGLCPSCRRLLRPQPAVVPLEPDTLTVVASAAYSGTAERVVRRWKDIGHTQTASWAAHALAASVAFHGSPEPLLVPVPATRRSRRRRGGWLVAELAAEATAVLAGAGVRAEVAPLARLVRQPADQRRLGVVERARNTRGAFAARPAPRGREVLVVDDVVTTGSTLRAVAAALERAGADVAGAAVVVATPPPHPHRVPLVDEPSGG